MIIFYQIIFQKYSGEIISPFRPIFSPQNIAKILYKYCITIPIFFQRKNMNIAANLRTSYSGAVMGFSLLTASQILRGDPFRLCRNMWLPPFLMPVLPLSFRLRFPLSWFLSALPAFPRIPLVSWRRHSWICVCRSLSA